MRALATWCVRHRRTVVLAWVCVLVVVTLSAHVVGTAYSSTVSLPATESTRAAELLHAASPTLAGDAEQIVVSGVHGASVTSPAARADLSALLARVATIPHVASVDSPYAPGASWQVSADHSAAFATVHFDEATQAVPGAVARDLLRTATSGRHEPFSVAVAGQLAQSAQGQSLGSMGLGVLLAGVVLLLAFGSLFAMLLPLVSALASLGTAVGLISLISHAMNVPDFASELVLLIGLGVGVDYALFIVTRHRQGLRAGVDAESSIVTAVNTSGRAVLLAGVIVCVALLGMLALGITFLNGMAVAAATGVLLTVVATLTLLPALLGFIGPHALSRRQRARLAHDGPQHERTSGFWCWWSGTLVRRPLLPAVVALVVIVVVAVPFFFLRLGTADQGSDPAGSTTLSAYTTLTREFGPGYNGPLQLVSTLPGSGDRAVLDRVAADVARQPDVARVGKPTVLGAPGHRGELGLVEVYPRSSPQSGATADLVTHLRQVTIPRAVAGSAVTVDIGGTTAMFLDFASVLSAKLPLFVAIVIIMSFVLLAVVFRSLVIPLTAAVMNLLAAGAAFGILVAVFQRGWLGAVIGVARAGPIEPFLPVMLLSILFGLSMDYEVFLVTRIHEEWVMTGDNRLAVRRGLAATGKTITAAALIMILVFGSFVLGGERVIKQFGLGLAGSILIDAIVIRSAVVPSLMLLAGRANWWFPGWLDRRLPRIAVDVPEEDLADELDGWHDGTPARARERTAA